jgi:aspartyl protease family protein
MGRGLLLLVIAIGVVSTFVGGRIERVPVPHAEKAGYEIATPPAQAGSSGTPTFDAVDGALELHRERDSHFYADVQINGAPIHMLVDTGASGIALSREDAQSAGVATSIGMNDVVGEGADGAVRGEWVRLDRVELGPLKAQGLQAIVLNSGEQSLLGQEFLSKFGSVEIHGDTMVLR